MPLQFGSLQKKLIILFYSIRDIYTLTIDWSTQRILSPEIISFFGFVFKAVSFFLLSILIEILFFLPNKYKVFLGKCFALGRGFKLLNDSFLLLLYILYSFLYPELFTLLSQINAVIREKERERKRKNIPKLNT